MEPGTLRLIPFATQPVVPWRNGAGTTREVAVDREGADGAFRWRISVAQVAEDGPFSSFPGIDRTIWLLRGAGMVLDVEGREHRLSSRLAPLAFDGAARVSARLTDGPTEDLNLMVERATTAATAEVLTLAPGTALPLQAAASGTVALLLLAGEVEIAALGTAHRLTAGDALVARGPIDARLEALDPAASVLLRCGFVPRRVGPA